MGIHDAYLALVPRQHSQEALGPTRKTPRPVPPWVTRRSWAGRVYVYPARASVTNITPLTCPSLHPFQPLLAVSFHAFFPSNLHLNPFVAYCSSPSSLSTLNFQLSTPPLLLHRPLKTDHGQLFSCTPQIC